MTPSRHKNSANSWQWRLTFLGRRMGHNYYLYYLLDQVFLQNPKIQCVVEIGTGHGAMTTVLGLWGVKLGIPVMSVDCNVLHDPKIFKHLDIRFLCADEWGELCSKAVRSYCRLPVFLICDGGNKIREFQAWAPLILPGSVIAVHDWGVEIGPSDVKETVSRCGLTPFLEHKWDYLNVQFAMWRKE